VQMRRRGFIGCAAGCVVGSAFAQDSTLHYRAHGSTYDPFAFVKKGILSLDWNFDLLNRNGKNIHREDDGLWLTHKTRSIISQPDQGYPTPRDSWKFFERHRTFTKEARKGYVDLLTNYIDSGVYSLPAVVDAAAYLLTKVALNEVLPPPVGLAGDVIAAYSIIEKFVNERRAVEEAIKMRQGLQDREDGFIVTSLEAYSFDLTLVHEVMAYQAFPDRNATAVTLWTRTYKRA
jgi:hypothetical protein